MRRNVGRGALVFSALAKGQKKQHLLHLGRSGNPKRLRFYPKQGEWIFRRRIYNTKRSYALFRADEGANKISDDIFLSTAMAVISGGAFYVCLYGFRRTIPPGMPSESKSVSVITREGPTILFALCAAIGSVVPLLRGRPQMWIQPRIRAPLFRAAYIFTSLIATDFVDTYLTLEEAQLNHLEYKHTFTVPMLVLIACKGIFLPNVPCWIFAAKSFALGLIVARTRSAFAPVHPRKDAAMLLLLLINICETVGIDAHKEPVVQQLQSMLSKCGFLCDNRTMAKTDAKVRTTTLALFQLAKSKLPLFVLLQDKIPDDTIHEDPDFTKISEARTRRKQLCEKGLSNIEEILHEIQIEVDTKVEIYSRLKTAGIVKQNDFDH